MKDSKEELNAQESTDRLLKEIERFNIENEISKEERDCIIDEWNSIPCLSFAFTTEQLLKMKEK